MCMARGCPLIHIANLDKEVDFESIVFANRKELERGCSRPLVAILQDLLVGWGWHTSTKLVVRARLKGTCTNQGLPQGWILI